MGFPAECLGDFNRDPIISLPVLSNLLTHSPDRALPVSGTETRSGCAGSRAFLFQGILFHLQTLD